MEALYKMKKPKTGQADRTMRAKLKDTASKSSRANLLDAKRRIPLSEVQSSNKVPEQEVVKKEKPAMSRAERLVEWKKQREEAKAKQRQNDKQNPPFRPGGKKPTLKSAPVHAPAVAKTAPPAAVKKSAPSTSSTTASATSTQAKKTVKKANTGPSRSSARLAAKQPASTSGTQKMSATTTTTTRKNTNAPEPVKPRTKAQQTAGNKKTASTAKPPVNRGRSGRSDVIGAASTKTAARKLPSKTQENSNERRVTTRSKASSSKSSGEIKRGSTSKIKTNRKTEIKKVEETDSDMPVDPPTTPKKGSYAPIHPSPLLKRRVAPVRRETVYVPQFVNEPAWIPGTQQSVNFTSGDPNFDEAFKASFSPFRFTAMTQPSEKFSPTPSQQPQQQQFVLELQSPLELRYDTSSSQSETEVADTELSQSSVVSPPARKRRRSSRRCSRRLDAMEPLVVNVRSMEVNVHSMEESSESKSDEEKCLIESPMEEEEEGTTTGSEEGVDIGYFRGLHDQVTEKFMRLCQEWEEKSDKLDQEYTSGDGTVAEDINVEDVLGQIRTTVGQAQLLMRKKLKQYMSLVEEAQDPTVEKRANADDLQSFWDMVYFQVEDVQKKFDMIEKLEKNGWKHKAPTPARKRTKKATKAGTKKAASSSSEETTERLQAARDKRQAQRNRLKEMKLAAKRAREQEEAELAAVEQPPTTGTGGENTMECQEEPLPITPSPKKTKLAHTPKVNSSGRHRRRSQRLLARSVFSPIQSTRSANIHVHEVPIGCLVSLN